jgi:hypothetical protein
MVSIQEKDNEAKQRDKRNLAQDVPTREDTQTQAQEQQGHDPGGSMGRVNRLTQE